VRVIETGLAGVLLIEPSVHRDARGFFLETWHARRYEEAGIAGPFVQDNHSRSVRGTLRGLHWQHLRPQGKLVRVIEGEIYDVAVDIRPDSPTFGHWVGATLSADSFLQIYVPVGYAHGFCVTSDQAQVEYKCTDVYDAADERGLPWDDPDLAIDWPVKHPILSPRDQNHPSFREVFGIPPAGR
jgi:dTDP-4-dehydrorhamnose 3,5-epimerase